MSLISASFDGQVARLRLTRAEKRNALNHALVAEALDAMDRFETEGTAVGILEADGDIFCAGNDLAEAHDDPGRSASADFLAALIHRRVFWLVALTGPVLGSGVAVACTCPVVVASDTAWLALPEVQRVGAYPSVVQSYLEVSVGPRMALDLCLTGSPVSATAAVGLGLVTEVLAASEVRARTAKRAAQLAATSPRVVTAARESWQSRFRAAQFLERREVLDEVFRRQLPDPPDSGVPALPVRSARPAQPARRSAEIPDSR